MKLQRIFTCGIVDYSRRFLMAATCVVGLSLCPAKALAQPGVRPVQNGVAVINLSGTGGSQVFHKITLPAGQGRLDIKTAGGTGDCDLYVKFGSLPTLSNFEYSSDESGNNEEIRINSPAAGEWYVLLHGYSAYSGLTLSAGYGVPDLTKSAESISRTAVAAGESIWVSLSVLNQGGAASDSTQIYFYFRSDPLDYSSVTRIGHLNLPGLNPGAKVTGLQFTHTLPQNALSGAYALSYWIDGPGLVAESDENNNTGTWTGVSVSGLPVQILGNNLASSGLSGAASSFAYFKITVPSGQAKLEILTSGGSGNCDLYVNKDLNPPDSNYRWGSQMSGNAEKVTIIDPDPGEYIVLLHGAAAYAGVTLVAKYEPPPPPNGHYYAVSTISGTWHQVEEQAVNFGGHLVSIASSGEQHFLVKTFLIDANAKRTFWTGLTDRDQEGVYKWVDGTQFAYNNWNPQEPNNCGGEDFGTLNWHIAHGRSSSVPGDWNDAPFNGSDGCLFGSPENYRGIIEFTIRPVNFAGQLFRWEAVNTPIISGALSNIRAFQRSGTKLVDIYFDLSSGAEDPVNIVVGISADRGNTHAVPATRFSGDGFGLNGSAGNARHIVWDAGADYDGQFSMTMRLKVAISSGGSVAEAVSPIFTLDTRSVLTGSIFGRVIGSGVALANAQVRVMDMPYTTTSAAGGEFNISNIPPGVGYLLSVSAPGYAVQSFPNIKISQGPNNLGDLFLGQPVNLPAQLRPLVPDVNPAMTTVEEGGTAYRYYQIVATDGRTLVGVPSVSLRRAGGASIQQDGDFSQEWAGYEAGKPDGDGVVRLRLPSSAIGPTGSTATFEVLVSATVVQTFVANVKEREYEQVWKHKWSIGGVPPFKDFSQSHETTIVRKFGGPDNGIEIIGRERDEEFKKDVKLEFGSRLGRIGAGASVSADGRLSVRLGQSFRFSPDTTDVLDNLLKLDAAFSDNINLVPVGGVVLEALRQELLGFISPDRIESTDTALNVSGHVKADAGFGLAWPFSDELAIYVNTELAADVAAEIGAMDYPGRYFDSYIELSGNVKWEFDSKNTILGPVFFQPGGSVKGTVRRDPDGLHPRKLILESMLSVTTDSTQSIPGWNENDILDLQPLEKAEYRNQYTLRLPDQSDAMPAAQTAWESVSQRGQGSVLKLSQPVAWLSSVLGAGEPVAYEKFIYSAETTMASSPLLEEIDIKLTGEKEKGALVRTESGSVWKIRRLALESYSETPRLHYPIADIFDLEKKWLGYASGPLGRFLNRAVHIVDETGEKAIEAGGAALRFTKGAFNKGTQVTTTWINSRFGGGQPGLNFALRNLTLQSLNGFLPPVGASNYKYGIGGVFRFESTNTLNGVATLTIPFTAQEIAGLNEADLRIYHLPGGTNRWRLVDGAVNAISNTVTASITNLGTFAIAPPLPSGDLVLSSASNTLMADGLATSLITVSNLLLNHGQAATQLWLYTVGASGVEIVDLDVTTNYPGVQLVSTNGVLRFTVRASLGGHNAKVAVASVAGDAVGELGINLVDSVAPQVPSAITVSAGQSRLFLTWRANTEPDLAGYRLYYRAGTAGPPWDGTAAVEGLPSPVSVAGTNFTLRGLASGSNYFVALATVDTTGNESPPTKIGPLTLTNTPPQPPTGLAVSFGADSTNFLSWALSEDDGYNDRDVARYEVYRAVVPGGAFVRIGEAPAGVGLYGHTNVLVPAGSYLRYAVLAVDTNGQPSAQVLANSFLPGGIGVDNDRDGMADDWEHANGLNAQNAADALLDNDSDGLSNLAEYRAGTDPTNANSFLAFETIEKGDLTGTNRWVRITWGSRADRVYEIQRASIVTGPFTPISSHILATPPLNSYLDTTTTNTSQVFYRLRVE